MPTVALSTTWSSSVHQTLPGGEGGVWLREMSSQVDPLLSNMPQSVQSNVCDNNSVCVSLQAVGAQRGVTNDGRLGSPNSPKEDRRHNLIFCGISESPEGTSFRERLKTDYAFIFSAVEPLVTNSSSGSLHSAIRTCTRLDRLGIRSDFVVSRYMSMVDYMG